MASEVELVYNRFPEHVRELPLRCQRAEIKCADAIALDAKMRAPRLNRAIVTPSFQRYPGEMADSIEVGSGDDDSTAVFVGRFWGLFVEHGTKHMQAEPFLVPALHANEPELVGHVEYELKRL